MSTGEFFLKPEIATDMNIQDFFPEIVGSSDSLKKILQSVKKVARCDASVLIFGESGTGKELIASSVHRLSERASKPFIAINCSAIPEQLLESELFGHEKGAFTGADRRRHGLLKSAQGGSVFLDEIGDMPFSLQAKLLRVLQNKQYTPLGSNETHRVDVRIIAATHVNLKEAITQGRFRQDLYYRLNVLPVVLPPLRDRIGDIAILADHFLHATNRLHRFVHPCKFATDVLQKFLKYSWPGNIRELHNVVERMAVYAGGGILQSEHLPSEILLENQDMVEIMDASVGRPTIDTRNLGKQALPERGFSLDKYIQDIENSYICDALKRTNNNKNQAAKLLGINRTTLVERIKKRKISIEE